MRPAAKAAVFVLGLLPFAWLVDQALTNHLGTNTAGSLVRDTGDWSLRVACIGLALTPLRQLTGTPALARFRRMLGLLHCFWMRAGKNNFSEVSVHAAILRVLLDWRVAHRLHKPSPTAARGFGARWSAP